MSTVKSSGPVEQPWSLEEFLEILPEMPDGERWELIGGRIYKMMVGGTTRHRRIVANVAYHLSAQLRRSGRSCDVYSESTRVQSASASFFPNVVVTCEPQQVNSTAIESPTVLVEVLSRTTREKDETTKLDAYRSIPSLVNYIIIDQTRLLVRITERQSDGTWSWRTLESQEAGFDLAAIGASLTLAEIYERVFEDVG
ncbi:Uma2 family endonuclease [Chthonobacter albigriseus]|uniref:Uma2 family endonuclease n=1 Tax=Chthonobacter albigriseus TaxID=1683161 RepID=UPI0015EE8E66|nr:Uma2 family endonuclease [Chthonobacter albigriseus]